MVEIWYTIIAFTLTVYLVLDGRNFGAGALHAIVAKTALERRQVVAAIGPLWSWHEVWIVATGGLLFVAFPRFLAVAFAGYYLALFLVLWSLILRGISLEVGGHIDNPLWQQFWDFIFSISSITLAALFGVGARKFSQRSSDRRQRRISNGFLYGFPNWRRCRPARLVHNFDGRVCASAACVRTERPISRSRRKVLCMSGASGWRDGCGCSRASV